MKKEQIIKELDTIMAYCDVAKEKAAGLRKKMGRIYGPSSRKREMDMQIAKVLAKRKKTMQKKVDVH